MDYRIADAVGNLFRKGDRSDRTYGPAGRLLEDSGTRYTYDAEGNLIQKITPDGQVWTYTWDSADRLASVVRPDKKTVSFAYDALGRRIEKRFAGRITRWVWDGDQPLHEWTEADEAGVDDGRMTPTVEVRVITKIDGNPHHFLQYL